MNRKDLLKCSLDELRQNAIDNGNLDRYRECNRLISVLVSAVSK